MCLPCGYLTFFTLLPFFYLVPIKHAFSLHYKHVDHATFTSLHPHVLYLYKLVSRVLCSLIDKLSTRFTLSNLSELHNQSWDHPDRFAFLEAH